jgi:predicted RNase H-like HicB family nuclease
MAARGTFRERIPLNRFVCTIPLYIFVELHYPLIKRDDSKREEDIMLSIYIKKTLEKAQYKLLDDGTWFAEIPGFQGVWANKANVEECRHELVEVLEEWLILKIRDRDFIPTIEGVGIGIREVAAA